MLQIVQIFIQILYLYFTFQDEGERKILPRPAKRKGGGKRKTRAPRDNEHMKDILENYDEMTADKAKK